MRIIRWILGIILILYGLFDLAIGCWMIAVKAGAVAAGPSQAKMGPLIAAMHWWDYGLWVAVAALLLLSGWRLIRRAPALLLYVAAVVVSAIQWWPMAHQDAYRQAFTPAERQLDYVTFAVMAVIGLAIWWIERRGTAVTLQPAT